MDSPSDGDPTDKVDYSHALEIPDSLEPREVQNRESSMEVGPSSDTPRAREVRAGEEGWSVVRNVIDNVVDDFLRKPHVACSAHPEDPLHLPGEVFATEP